ncbi:hypothetical protein INQ51_17780 [Maribellus sp. CM-23]|uniref:hypothetical protein n=1 Tax=Maribellus sp. CM-23 TaxID=2781026 RepID=UPI001F410407|nr:hypothetical protein [Maribellus sp. CM-23]MCE4566175.1 hypothetical protein [Maribellus sp. CM-23]
MAKKSTHIIRWVVGVILVLLTVANAFAQDGAKPVPELSVTQCDTLEVQVVDFPADRYTWDLYSDPNGNFAISQGDMESAIYFENGMYEGFKVRVIDLPTGTYFLRVMAWDEVECTNNLMVFKLEVIEPPPPIVYGDSVCVDEVPVVRIIFTGNGPWTFTYTYSDGVTTVNGNGESDIEDLTMPIMNPLPEGKYIFWIMEVVDGCGIAREYSPEERPGTGILIYPKPTKQPIYLKEE